MNDDSPVVEKGASGVWFVDWHDGTTTALAGLYGGKERERFLAMAEGEES